MLEEHAAPQAPNEQTHDNPAVEVFARFGDRHYALIPHTNRYARALFMNLWLAPLVLLALFLFFSGAAVATAEEPRNVAALLRACGPRLGAQGCVENGPDLTDHEWTSAVMSFLTAVLALPVLLSTVAMSLVVRSLTRRFPQSLHALVSAGRLRPGETPPGPALRSQAVVERSSGKEEAPGFWRLWPRSWSTYADDLEQAMVHPLRLSLFAFWLLIMGYFATAIVREIGATETVVIWSTVYAFAIVLIGLPLVAYYLSFVVWHLIVIAGYMRRLLPHFRFDIQPEHGDGCGGLHRLGQVNLRIFIIIAIPSALLALLWWTGVLTLVNSLFLATLIVLSLLIFLAPLAFFGPLWRVHTEMVSARARYQDEAVASIAPLAGQLRELVAQGRLDERETEKLHRQLAQLRTLYPATGKYPTWPFSTRQLIAFLSSQVVTVLTIVTALYELGDRF